MAEVDATDVKVFPGAAGASERALSACARDVSRAAALEHPNIGRALAVGRLEDGTPFITMERQRGETLKELLDRRGSLPLAEVRAVVLGVTAALSAAHAEGLAHGDLRPENVFLVDGDVSSIKLLNFGARHLLRRARWRGARSARGAFSPLDDQRALAALARTMLSGAPAAKRARARSRKGALPRRAALITWIVAVFVSAAVLIVGGWLLERGATMPRPAPASMKRR
jgi:serine/threonine protein kinase